MKSGNNRTCHHDLQHHHGVLNSLLLSLWKSIKTSLPLSPIFIVWLGQHPAYADNSIMSTHSQEALSIPSVRVYRSQSVQPVNDSDIVTRRRSGSVCIPARATSATPFPTYGGNGSRNISRSVPNSPPIRHYSAVNIDFIMTRQPTDHNLSPQLPRRRIMTPNKLTKTFPDKSKWSVTTSFKKSYSDEYLHVRRAQSAVSDGGARRHSVHYGTNLPNQFHNSKSSEHLAERRRRPSYMGDTCTSERRKLNNHSMAQKLDHPDDSESSGEDQELHQTTPEFRFGPPIVLPPIWKTIGGAQNSQRLQKGQKQRTSRTKRVPII